MDQVLSRKQMQDLDNRTIRELGIPSRVLMEVAGARCADAILREYPEEVREGVIVLCGTGNNGGDGYVIARHLQPCTNKVLIFCLGAGKMSAETAVNRKLCEDLNIPILDLIDQQDIEKLESHAFPCLPLLVDAVFGIGFKGNMPPVVTSVFARLKAAVKRTVAIDIPSGLNADSGNQQCLKADLTLAIEALKYGHLLHAGPAACGRIIRIPIGIPQIYRDEINNFLYNQLILPTRPKDAHKGDFGRVFIFGGSPGYTGSIRLTARAALRSGAGLVHLCSRQELIGLYSSAIDEVMNFAIPEADGMPDEERVKELISKADAISIGSGMGIDAYALRLLTIVLKHAACPTVIDADAITLLAENPQLLPQIGTEKYLLTPHPGEFCRLAKIDPEALRQDPVASLSALRKAVGCNILLKGHTSLVASKDANYFIRAGNDALATGGSGDLLAGIIASFAAQGLPLWQAACSATLLMGKTAERLSLNRHSYSILPSDIIEHLGDTNA
jgi:NAD(P)H-hydrate epimerase